MGNLIHHHVSISLSTLSPPAQLAFLSFEEQATEVRLHFWTLHPGFPATARHFCTHLDYEQTVRYDGTASFLMHTPEHLDVAQPSRRSCGDPSTNFILDLNRAIWEELQNPVVGLTALRVAIAAKMEQILQGDLNNYQREG